MPKETLTPPEATPETGPSRFRPTELKPLTKPTGAGDKKPAEVGGEAPLLKRIHKAEQGAEREEKSQAEREARAAIAEAKRAAAARKKEAVPTLTEAEAASEQRRLADEFLLKRWQEATEAQREAIKVAFPNWRSPEAATQPEVAGAETLNPTALAASILETPLREDSAQIGGWVDRATRSLGTARETSDVLFAVIYTNTNHLLKGEKVEAGVSTQVREERREVKILERSQAVIDQAGANHHIPKLYDAFTRHGIGLDADRAVRLAVMCVISTNQEGNPVAWGASRDAELPGLEAIYSLRALDHEQATLNKAKETLHHKPGDTVAQRTAEVAEKRLNESALDFSNTATALVQKVLTGEINLDETSILPARETDVVAILETRKEYVTATAKKARERDKYLAARPRRGHRRRPRRVARAA